MKYFIKPGYSNYHHESINNFSDLSTPITTGVSKGYSSEKYSWLSDSKHKFSGNTYTNKIKAEWVFYNDDEIIATSYKDVKVPDGLGYDGSTLKDIYNFISDYDEVDYGVKYEFTTKQYALSSNDGFESANVSFVNDSDRIMIENSEDDTFFISGYGDRKPYVQLGVRYADDDAVSEIFRYVWIPPANNIEVYDSTNSVKVKFVNDILHEQSITLGESGWLAEAANSSDIKRIFYYSVNYDTFDNDNIMDDTNIYVGVNEGYTPTVYSVINSKPSGRDYNKKAVFKPTVFDGAKVTGKSVEMNISDDTIIDINTGVKNKEYTDQSYVTYNFSSYTTTRYSYYYSKLYYRFGNKVINGIDTYVEATRCTTGTVSAEPYMITEPIMKGKQAGVKIDHIYRDAGQYIAIETTQDMISSINRVIDKEEYNTDIIETVVLKNPDMEKFNINTTDPYSNFGGSSWMDRINASLHDRVDSYISSVGEGEYYSFYISASKFSNNPELYDGNKMRVVGMSIEYKPYMDDNGFIRSNLFVRLYCNNFVPDPSFNKNGSIPLVLNEVSIIPDLSAVGEFHTDRYEKIYPMLRLASSNGNYKLTSFIKSEVVDGKLTAYYSFEMPYAAKSRYIYSTHSYGSKNEFVYEVKSYINSGSWELDSNGKKNIYNHRYMPYADDAFGIAGVYRSVGIDGYPESEVYISYTDYAIRYSILSKKSYRNRGVIEMVLGASDNVSKYKLNIQFDNRAWDTAEGKKLPYIGRENPAALYTIDISNAINNKGDDYLYHSSIPDVKRYVYALYKGLSNTMAKINDIKPASDNFSKSNIESVKRDGFGDIPSLAVMNVNESDSDTILEILKKDGDKFVWEPIIISSSDNVKLKGDEIYDRLFIYSGDVMQKCGDMNMYVIKLNRVNEDFTFGIDADIINSLPRKHNFVMEVTSKDGTEKRIYNINYIGATGNQITLLSTMDNDSYSFLIANTFGIMEPVLSGNIKLFFPIQNINGSIMYSIESNTDYNKDGEPDPLYIDLLDEDSSYIIDNKIAIRVRVKTGNLYTYAMNYDGSYDMMFKNISPDTNCDLYSKRIFPWYDYINDKMFDGFDYNKVSILERVKRLGVTYFKVSSI